MSSDGAGVPRLVLLDGIRGIAALGVVLFHTELGAFNALFGRGYLLVDLFFMLSGFVLSRSFDQAFRAGLGTRKFLWRRYKRFAPLVVAGSLIGLFTSLAQGAQPFGSVCLFVLSAWLVPMPQGEVMFPLNVVQWSLLVELAANAAHAAWLFRWSCARLLGVAVVCLAGFALCAVWQERGDLGSTLGQFPAGLLRAGWSYTLGMVVARLQSGARPVGPKVWKAVLAAPVLVTAAVALLPLPVWAGDLLVIGAAWPAIFWLATMTACPEPARRWLVWLGALSFPLYALHRPIAAAVAASGLPVVEALAGIPGLVVALVVAAAIVAAQPSAGRWVARVRISLQGGRASSAPT